jgi:hypothetical protein
VPKPLLIILIICFGSKAMAGDYEINESYSSLRTQVLSLSPAQLGTDAPVIAVLMETGYQDAVATLVAISDGSASLYISKGGGIIGAGEYEQVHNSSIALITLAGNNLEKFTTTTEFPLPGVGFTRFYVVTPSGVFTKEVLEDDLGNERDVLSPVFFQGHELMSYIRAVDEHPSNAN